MSYALDKIHRSPPEKLSTKIKKKHSRKQTQNHEVDLTSYDSGNLKGSVNQEINNDSLSKTKKKNLNDSSTQHDPVEETYLFPDCKTLKSLCSKNFQSHHTVRLKGYEIYIVEQWACERRLSSVILSYTGNSDHQVEMISVNLPKIKDFWKECFKTLLQEIEQSGARETVTEHGTLHISNISSLPSYLNLLPVPSGNSLSVWEYFKVNVNLRRMNCLGRSALILAPPTDATEDKFRQIYKIASRKVDICYAVEELVTLIQIVLVDFKLHDPNLVDGLLCNMTKKNIQTWWKEFGSFYPIQQQQQPKDGIMGPSTVSAMIGFVLSCSFRLDIAGADFPKEPFNYVNFRVNVGKFQKQYNLEQTWYLDSSTVHKLFKVTCKIPTSDISKLKNVVKSRVNDISRRANYNVIASELLTIDLEKISQKYFHYSARLDYMWNGKGNICDLKKFDYIFEQDILPNTNAFRSSVGKIKNIPKKLNEDSSKTKKYKKSSSRNKPDQEDRSTVDEVSPLNNNNNNNNTCIISSPPISLPDPNISTECVSISEEFTKNLHRRNSFPFTPEELNIPQLKYENHTIKLNIYSNNIRLKRSKSFSIVESTLLKIDPIITTPIKLIQVLKTINLKLQTQKEIQTQYMNFKIKFEDSLNNIIQKELKLNLKTKPLFYNADIQFQSNERLNFKLEDIEHLGSRLQYEMRVLGNTIRDAKDGIDIFIAKMDVLENLLDERCKEGDNNWLKDLWDTFQKGLYKFSPWNFHKQKKKNLKD